MQKIINEVNKLNDRQLLLLAIIISAIMQHRTKQREQAN